MKRFMLAVTLGLFFSLQSQAQFQAGAATEDITPTEWPVNLVGSFNPREANSAHDPLMARAMVLSDGKMKVAICVVDNCLIEREFLDAAKAIVLEKTGIPTEHQLISATHTHSAPPGRVASNHFPGDESYQEKLPGRIAAAIIKAHEKLQPASVGFGSGELPDEVFNRRWYMKEGTMPVNPFGDPNDKVKMNPPRGPSLVKPAAGTDPEICVLSVVDAKNKPLGLLANYSLHYVGRTPSGQVSADYFGEFGRLMPIRLRSVSPDFVAIMSNGTSGDINNIRFTDPRPGRDVFEQIRIVAGKAADVATRAHKEIDQFSNTATLAMVERIIPLERRKPTDQQIERAREIVKMTDEDAKKLPRLAVNYARRTLALLEQPEIYNVKIQALRIGENTAICALPFETLVEIGLELKDKSPFANTFTIELANGWYAYLPTPEQHELGGYETWLSTNKVQKDASVILTKNLLEMLDEVKTK